MSEATASRDETRTLGERHDAFPEGVGFGCLVPGGRFQQSTGLGCNEAVSQALRRGIRDGHGVIAVAGEPNGGEL